MHLNAANTHPITLFFEQPVCDWLYFLFDGALKARALNLKGFYFWKPLSGGGPFASVEYFFPYVSNHC